MPQLNQLGLDWVWGVAVTSLMDGDSASRLRLGATTTDGSVFTSPRQITFARATRSGTEGGSRWAVGRRQGAPTDPSKLRGHGCSTALHCTNRADACTRRSASCISTRAGDAWAPPGSTLSGHAAFRAATLALVGAGMAARTAILPIAAGVTADCSRACAALSAANTRRTANAHVAGASHTCSAATCAHYCHGRVISSVGAVATAARIRAAAVGARTTPGSCSAAAIGAHTASGCARVAACATSRGRRCNAKATSALEPWVAIAVAVARATFATWRAGGSRPPPSPQHCSKASSYRNSPKPGATDHQF
jgi:hypothetical protein